MSRVLVVSPHPDDESIGCGGTLRRHVVEGDSVRAVFLTSGEQGGHGKPPDATAAIREQEARTAAAILGLEAIEFWREPDGRLRASPELVTRLSTTIREWKPDLLYVTHAHEMPSDHRAAAELVCRTLDSQRLSAGLAVRTYEVWTPVERLVHIVDISDYIEVKMAAVRAHESQCDVMRFDEAILGLNRYRGEMHSWPGGDYAEVFSNLA